MLINWSRVLPRLVLLFVLLLVLWWARDRLVVWQLRSNIARQTGAKAEIGSVRTDLANAELTVTDLRLYDPKHPDRKLFRADKAVIKGSGDDLLYRHFHFPEITVEGIRIEVEGTDGSRLVPDKLWSKFKERIPKELEPVGELDWTVFLTDKPEDAAKQMLGQLETSRLVADLKQRWPQEVHRFEEAVALVRNRFQNVKKLSETSGRSVDKLQLLQEILKELEDADLGIQQLFGNVTQLKMKAQQDSQAIVDAARRDQEKIRSLKVPTIDADRISETIVGPEIREQWEKSVAWGDWAASLLAPVTIGDETAPIYERFGLTPPKRVRGETIHLTAFDVRPELLIDKIDMSGQILFGTVPVFFNGAVRDIAHPVRIGPGPTVAQFCFSGFGVPDSPLMPEEEDPVLDQINTAIDPNVFPNLYVTLNVDRIGENEEDVLIVCCPLYQLPQRILGNESKFAVAVSPGATRLDGVVILRGENLSGEIRLAQSGVRLAAILPPKLQQTELHRLLDRLFSSLEQFEAKLLIGGTRSQPVYTVKSNIGDVIRPQLENIALSEWNSLRQEIDRNIAAEANQGLTALDTMVRRQIDPVMQDVNTTRSEWERQLASISDVPLDQLVQSQLTKLSPKDRQRLEGFMQSPALQSLMQQPPAQNEPAAAPPLDQTIQRGVDKLQDKIPGLLDKLRKK